MLKLADSMGRALALAALLLAANGCGVQGHKIAVGGSGAAGDGIIDPGSGAAGTSGAAGAGSGLAGVSGAAGDGSPAGAAGVSGAAGDGNQGVAGTNGAAGTGSSGVAGTSGAAGTNGSGAAGTTGAAGTGAPSGVTINIGGTMVPKEDVIAFIHFGHSNMAGRGMNPTASRPYHFMQTDPHAWMYHAASQAPFPAGAKAGFELAIEPKTAGDSRNNRNPSNPYGGPGTTLAKQAAALAPGKYAVSLGFGQASAYCAQFKPGALYYDKLASAAKELKGKVTFGGIVILLGITERHGTMADLDGFPACIKAIADQLRADTGEPNLPVLISGYEMGATRNLAPTTAFAKLMIDRIAQIPMLDKNAAVIDTTGIPIEVEPNEPDGDHHFTLDGHRMYMGKLLQTMKDKGWWRW
jgi:hypothetical protein